MKTKTNLKAGFQKKSPIPPSGDYELWGYEVGIGDGDGSIGDCYLLAALASG